MLYAIAVLQIIMTVVMIVYFSSALKDRHSNGKTVKLGSDGEAAHIAALRKISLTRPLTETLRPTSQEEIVGQDKGMRALKNALCGPNPQHVIIYGPPGVGKTAAARIAMELAKQSDGTPFKNDAPFIEADATIMQFDERAIADPLLGSVHDPIYQGAGAYGSLGIPRPKEGAVTKAHGGVLFLDEIGELSTYHLNRLLKVLEEGKVHFYSSYYSEKNRDIPPYIHDIFKNGMPADFRLIGATTRRPEELPPALRSRCREIFFDELKSDDARLIAENSCKRLGAEYEATVPELVGKYCTNGRDSVNVIQNAWSAVIAEGRKRITAADIKDTLSEGRFVKRHEIKLSRQPRVGIVNGLAVCGSSGSVITVEASAVYGGGGLSVRGIAFEEEVKGGASHLKRKGSALESAENVLEVLEQLTSFRRSDYHISINFPESRILDGPSAGAAMLLAVYSAVYNIPVRGDIALTGEVGLKGDILPVGGIAQKVAAAVESGAYRVYIPLENADDTTNKKAVPIQKAEQILNLLSLPEESSA